MVAHFSKFYGKTWVGFYFNTGKTFSLRFHFALDIFKIAIRLRDRHVFIWQSMEILRVFNTLTLKQIFWKTKTFFKNLEYRFLVQSTKIEKASFPYKTAISEANVKTNRIVSTKWTYHKKQSFASNCFIFWKLCCLRTS